MFRSRSLTVLTPGPGEPVGAETDVRFDAPPSVGADWMTDGVLAEVAGVTPGTTARTSRAEATPSVLAAAVAGSVLVVLKEICNNRGFPLDEGQFRKSRHTMVVVVFPGKRPSHKKLSP